MKSTYTAERRAMLKNNEIKFFFYDAQWRGEWAWEPDTDRSLQKVFEKGEYKIYRIL